MTLTFQPPKENKDTFRLSTLVDHLRPPMKATTKAQEVFNDSLKEMGAFIHQHVQNRFQREYYAKDYDVQLEPQCLYYIPELDANISFHADLLMHNKKDTYLYEIKSYSALQRHKDYCLAQASAYYYAFQHKLNKPIIPQFISYSIATSEISFTPMDQEKLLEILRIGTKTAKPRNDQYYYILNNINTNLISRKILVKQCDLFDIYKFIREHKYREAEEKLKEILF